MANVFTYRNNYPRATSQKDQGTASCFVYGWKMSEIRSRNKYQNVLHEDDAKPPKRSFRAEKSMALPSRLYPESVNFTCGKPLPPRARGEIPVIKYDASSTQRTSYSWPVYPEGVPLERNFQRYGFTSERAKVLGIIPNAPAPEYKPLPILARLPSKKSATTSIENAAANDKK